MPPLDKQAHFLAGAAIASAEVAYGVPPLVAILSAWVIGGLKELWDFAGNGTPDPKDWLATALGAIVIAPLALMDI